MTRKEKMELILSKLEEGQKDKFVEEFREAKTMEERKKVAKKYNASLTTEEEEQIKAEGNKVSDEQLDQAAGGCCSWACGCTCSA